MKRLIQLIALFASLALFLTIGSGKETSGEVLNPGDGQIVVEQAKLEELIRAYEDSILQLTMVKAILVQEKERWQRIHTNPVPDNFTIKRTEKGYQMDVVIDSDIKNCINRQAITRTFNFTLTRENTRFFDNFDLLLIGTVTYPQGPRPALGIGFTPSLFGKTLFKHTAVGLYSSVYTTGMTIYYSHPKMRNVTAHILGGIDLEARGVIGVGLGMRF